MRVKLTVGNLAWTTIVLYYLTFTEKIVPFYSAKISIFLDNRLVFIFFTGENKIFRHIANFCSLKLCALFLENIKLQFTSKIISVLGLVFYMIPYCSFVISLITNDFVWLPLLQICLKILSQFMFFFFFLRFLN